MTAEVTTEVTAAPRLSASQLEQRILDVLLGVRRMALRRNATAQLWYTLGPFLVTALAALLRLPRLGSPETLVFDETYYVKAGYSMLELGYEGEWGEEPNAAFEVGDFSALQEAADYVVHPPLGKWLIGWGMAADPTNPALWRLSSALLGIAAVWILARVAIRLFGSVLWGTTAGFLMAIDGHAIVHSRTGLLDNHLMFFVLAAFACLVLDRERTRRRIASRAAALHAAAGHTVREDPDGVLRLSGVISGSLGRLGPRWWRWVAWLMLGCAVSVKWSGLYFAAVFGLLTVAWDLSARLQVRQRMAWVPAMLRDGAGAFFTMVVAVAGVYLASWIGWFRSDHGYRRHWAEAHPGEGLTWLPDSLRSLAEYHRSMWSFHHGLTSEHSYEAHPLGWLVQWRPTSFYWRRYELGEEGCDMSSCVDGISSIGNPVIWILGALALLGVVYFLFRDFDWRGAAVLSGIIGGWVPWLFYSERTIFSFYAIAFQPWLVLGLVYVLARIIDGPFHLLPDRRRRREHFGWLAGLALVTFLVSMFFYPIWTAMRVPYWFWLIHIWLPTWA